MYGKMSHYPYCCRNAWRGWRGYVLPLRSCWPTPTWWTKTRKVTVTLHPLRRERSLRFAVRPLLPQVVLAPSLWNHADYRNCWSHIWCRGLPALPMLWTELWYVLCMKSVWMCVGVQESPHTTDAVNSYGMCCVCVCVCVCVCRGLPVPLMLWIVMVCAVYVFVCVCACVCVCVQVSPRTTNAVNSYGMCCVWDMCVWVCVYVYDICDVCLHGYMNDVCVECVCFTLCMLLHAC